jgi:hypothetical protein
MLLKHIHFNVDYTFSTCIDTMIIAVLWQICLVLSLG